MAKKRTGSNRVPLEPINPAIVVIRGYKVILDVQLAQLYRVPTTALNQAVRRNIKRFPDDFAFELTAREVESLKHQRGAKSSSTSRSRPFAFTVRGVVQAALILNGALPAEVSVYVVRALMEAQKAHSDFGRRAQFRSVEQACFRLGTPIAP